MLLLCIIYLVLTRFLLFINEMIIIQNRTVHILDHKQLWYLQSKMCPSHMLSEEQMLFY